MEQRQGNIEVASSIYETAIEIEKGKSVSQSLPLLFIQYSRFLHLVAANIDRAREVLVGALHLLPLSKPLIEALIHFESIHKGAKQIDYLDSLVAEATTPKLDNSQGLSPPDQEEISSIFLEFVDLFGDIYAIKKAETRHKQLFPPRRSSSESRKHCYTDCSFPGKVEVAKPNTVSSASSAQAGPCYANGQSQQGASYAAQEYSQQSQSWQQWQPNQGCYGAYAIGYASSGAPQQKPPLPEQQPPQHQPSLPQQKILVPQQQQQQQQPQLLQQQPPSLPQGPPQGPQQKQPPVPQKLLAQLPQKQQLPLPQQLTQVPQQQQPPLPLQPLPQVPQQQQPPVPQQLPPQLPQQPPLPLPQQIVQMPQQQLPPLPQQPLPQFPHQQQPPLPHQSLPQLPQQQQPLSLPQQQQLALPQQRPQELSQQQQPPLPPQPPPQLLFQQVYGGYGQGYPQQQSFLQQSFEQPASTYTLAQQQAAAQPGYYGSYN
eukprot:Gb_37983 [translate_table: standard]